jgi:hypothetical protein
VTDVHFFNELRREIRTHSKLSEFSEHAPCEWIRTRGEQIDVFQVQVLSDGDKICVNLGVHFKFLPRAGVEKAVDIDSFTILDCELKRRLTTDVSSNDQWWPMVPDSAHEIADALAVDGLKKFDEINLHELEKISISDVESGRPTVLSQLTKVRALLLLARLFQWQGIDLLSFEAAEAGLRVAGMAVGPKKALRTILERRNPTT